MGENIEVERTERDRSGANLPDPIHDFRGMTTVVHPEGDDARVTIHTTAGPIRLTVAFEYIARANTEIRRAAILMAYRSTMKKDEGETSLSELLRTALRPDEVSIVVDKQTGDRFWVLQFDGHAPIVVCMSPEMSSAAQAQLAAVMKATAN